MAWPQARRYAALAAALGLAACAPPPVDRQAAAPNLGTTTAAAFAWVLRCGDRQATVGFDGDTMQLRAGDQSFALHETRAASGARYEAVGDPSTVFWSKGRSALVSVRGETWPECRIVAQGSQAWRAVGNEPGWHLEFYGPLLRFGTADGRWQASGRVPQPIVAGGTRRYAATTDAGALTATAVAQRCADTMSGMPHPDTVRVEFAGQTFSGCGGDPAALLRGGEWVVEDIGNAGVIDNARITLVFGPTDELSGRASCNRYSTRFRLSGEGLQIDPAATTRMACPPALMDQEARFLALMAQVQRHAFTPDGALLLIGADGKRILARRG